MSSLDVNSILLLLFIHHIAVIIGLPIDSMNHYDSVSEIESHPQKMLDYTIGYPSDSWPFSFWQYKSTENAAELIEFKSTLRDHNIIHLTKRPLAVYYHDDDIEIITTNISTNTKICRATISSTDIYHTLDTDDNSLNILFICSTGTCCGIDCCNLNITFIFALSCIFFTLSSFAGYFLLRSLKTSKKLRHLNPFKKHRIIKRVNATRKTRFHPDFELRTYQHDDEDDDSLDDSMSGSVPKRKKSQSVRIPGKQQTYPEILLIPQETKLFHSNSMPSKARKKNSVI